MNQRLVDQLDKVLALADSDHEGEALGALRMARRMLERSGLSFGDLAQSARRTGGSSFSRPSFFSNAQAQLQAQIDQLQDDLDAHVVQNESLTAQIEFWRRRSFELEQMLNLNQAETERWRQMARDTAERLWNLGQMAQAETALAAAQEEAMADEALETVEIPEIKNNQKEKRKAAGGRRS